MADETADQAIEQSVEDRIYGKFNNAPEQQEPEQQQPVEQDADSEQPDESEFAEVEYEGARYQVPKALEPALMKSADYTQKTQELARKREVYEQSMSTVQLMNMEAEFQQSVQEEAHGLRVLDNYIANLKRQDYNSMTAEDGIRQLLLVQQATQQREELSKSLEGKKSEFQSRFKGAITEAKQRTHDLLSKQISGYTPKSFDGVREYAKGQGFSDSVLDSIETDPKAAAVLYKAMRFDALQANKVAAVKKLDAPVIKPGSSKPMPDTVKNQFAFKKAIKAAATDQEKAKLIEQYMAR